jgi:hypothetical protein
MSEIIVTPRQVKLLRMHGLTPADVLQLREMWAAGVWEGYQVTVPMLAEIFLVRRRVVSDIVHQKAFKNVRKG